MTKSFGEWLAEIGLVESTLSPEQASKLREKFDSRIAANIAEQQLEDEESTTINPELLKAFGQARRRKCYLVAVMSAERDAIHVTEEHTVGVNVAIGCAALVKSVLGRIDKAAERKFLEEFVRELRS